MSCALLQAKLRAAQATVSPDARVDCNELAGMTNRRPGLMQVKPTADDVGILTHLAQPPASDRLLGAEAVVGNGDRDNLGDFGVRTEPPAITDQAVSAVTVLARIVVCFLGFNLSKSVTNR